MVRTQIYLSEKQYDLLKQKAHEQKITLSAVIRASLDVNNLPKSTQKPMKNWLHEMAIRAKKRGVKGPKDLSSNVDKYMYGDI